MIQWQLTSQMAAVPCAAALSFVRSESLKGRNSIGWIPWAGMIVHSENGRLGILTNNNDIVGFLLFGRSQALAKVVQIWVRPDARIIEHGKAMIGELGSWACRRQLLEISLWCAVDLEANLFWESLGFRKGTTRVGSQRTGRRHQRWFLASVTARQLQRREPGKVLGGSEKNKLQMTLPGWELADGKAR